MGSYCYTYGSQIDGTRKQVALGCVAISGCKAFRYNHKSLFGNPCISTGTNADSWDQGWEQCTITKGLSSGKDLCKY